MKKTLLSLTLLLGLVNIVQAQNPFNNCIRLDGVDDYILVPNTSAAYDTSVFSFECWTKRSSAASVFSKDRLFMSVPSGGWGVLIEGNRLKVTKVGTNEKQSNGMIADTLWHHVAVTHSIDTLCFYIDGIKDTCMQYTLVPSTSGQMYSIGARGNTELYTGLFDDVRIWNTARTAAQIFDNRCSELTLPQTGLVSYFKMNELTDTIVVDAVSSANNGTFMGNVSPLWTASTVPCSGVSINELSPMESKNIFPNPAKRSININLSESKDGNRKISIFNLLGSEVQSSSFSKEKQIARIDIEHLPSGIYFARISGLKQIQTLKFVKD